MSWPFQIAYEGDFRSLCSVIFGQKVDFLNSNTCLTRVSARDYTVYVTFLAFSEYMINDELICPGFS